MADDLKTLPMGETSTTNKILLAILEVLEEINNPILHGGEIDLTTQKPNPPNSLWQTIKSIFRV